MYEKELLGLSQISEANVQLIAAGRAIRNAVLANDDESRNRHTDAVLQRLQLLKEALNNSKRLFAIALGKKPLAVLKAATAERGTEQQQEAFCRGRWQGKAQVH